MDVNVLTRKLRVLCTRYDVTFGQTTTGSRKQLRFKAADRRKVVLVIHHDANDVEYCHAVGYLYDSQYGIRFVDAGAERPRVYDQHMLPDAERLWTRDRQSDGVHDFTTCAAFVCVAAHLFCAGMPFQVIREVFMTSSVLVCNDVICNYMKTYHPTQFRVMDLSVEETEGGLQAWDMVKNTCGKPWIGCPEKIDKLSRADIQRNYRARVKARKNEEDRDEDMA